MVRNPPRSTVRATQGDMGGRGHGRGGRGGRGGRTSRGSVARVHHVTQQLNDLAVDVDGETALLESGPTFVGFPSARQKVKEALNHQRFRAFYGIGPKAM